jgi:DNA-binding NarL/FixJ family response regulator
VTGRETVADRDRAASAGVNLHLVKPVAPGILLWALSRARAAGAGRVPAPTAPPVPPAPVAEVVRVLLADDHPVVRTGLRALIDAQPGLAVVGEAADGPAAVALAAELDPDVVVVDVSLPGLGGAQVTARLREVRPDRRVLALTVHEDPGYTRLLLDAGARGYALKRSAVGELVRAIRVVAAGGTYLDPAVAGAVVGDRVHPTPEEAELSERETEVVRGIALGYSNKEIAVRLGVSVKTVETYKTRALEKLHARSRVDLVRYAAGKGWLRAD